MENEQKLDAIILAGMQPIKNWSGTGSKALFRINGKAMIEYVIDALRKVDAIGRVIVAGPEEDLGKALKDKVDGLADSNGSIMDNVMAGINYLNVDRPLLVCSSDIPMITPEALKDFITRCGPLNADVCCPVVEKRLNDQKYPDFERTYFRMKEGTFTEGNVFYVRPAAVKKSFLLAEKLVNTGKNPLKTARYLGLGFLLRLLTGTLTIGGVDKRVSGLLGITVRTVISEYPEISNDVDKPTDVIIATAHLSK